MKKIPFLLVLLITIAVLPMAFAAETLDWGQALHSGPSACPDGGVLVVNITQKVINSVDSGTTRPVWAFEDYVRHIRVIDTGSEFCATVQYEGNFTSIAGDSPGAAYTGGEISDGVVGTFQGGYVSTLFTGDLKPGVRGRGSIGTYDYNCDDFGNCPGFVSWPDVFFDNLAGFDIGAWWGWIYHAGNNGSWQNACPSCGGNSGDITGD
ncbi:MAG: hypothetical protein UW81_C0023G0002 [Candidatus Giovannonibacteria bacterium GW2011_GWC2_44_9]|uniref:Uncharacterized protein n=3 Tax=Candidatus Giovannoniibacteriota TaxID=1752738 RepID=A0A0G1LUD8_9BACT|nr:MAG: hypothetical protein UW49_C0006G0002 [Candidatus Giovannonibacteria bacterium GW2011_GWB1_44_23]KKT63334.1 MAG: hypothetical protein UW57_C0008G0002 [Candidatus Giovannonibacteria bacterium GW2011_GWA1_44_29]KKT83224.1 MAG: hypothetical protein UW81_C0023G0002 [Candidatus Giovannonibacteria bacterium GW2011_GWC2_44_9]KKT91538.1 MAG: hypothetical protein UW93_C0005G0002 [Parcubacteria group bacterium GW2011_GWC1_45_13]